MVPALWRYSVGLSSVTLHRVQQLQRGFIRIFKGPTGSLLASLALAAFLGGVALAAPTGEAATPATDHPGGLELAALGDGGGGVSTADRELVDGKDVSSLVRADVLATPPVGGPARGAARRDAATGAGTDGTDRSPAGGSAGTGSTEEAGSPDASRPGGSPIVGREPSDLPSGAAPGGRDVGVGNASDHAVEGRTADGIADDTGVGDAGGSPRGGSQPSDRLHGDQDARA